MVYEVLSAVAVAVLLSLWCKAICPLKSLLVELVKGYASAA